MINLQHFCADADSARAYMIGRPWSRGAWTWATNGHIIVRVPRLAEVEENEAAPDAEARLAKQPDPVAWIDVPAQEMPADVKCEICNGAGHPASAEPCNKCGHIKDCEYCGGIGKVHNYSGVFVGAAAFQRRYLALLQGWQIEPRGLEPAWIKNHSALGLLMPMRRP